MAAKVFTGISGKTDSAEINSDYENSTKFGKVQVGKLGVYFRDGFKIRFMDYALLERVFIRVQEVNLKTCCGGSTTEYYRLVFVSDGREICNAISENGKAMEEALALIHENAPQIAIGYTGK